MYADREIYRITYTDAYYTYRKKLGEEKLPHHEAYGYLERKDGSLLVTFIKRLKKENESPMVEGLVIPEEALFSYIKNDQPKDISNFKEGDRVEVIWKDIVYVKNTWVKKSHRMCSRGILFNVKKDLIVLKKAKTARISPYLKKHPAKRPEYYIIPRSFIIDIYSTSNIFKKIYEKVTKRE